MTGNRDTHAPDCACCVAYGHTIKLFSDTAPDGQIGAFIEGVLMAAAHISAVQVKPDQVQAQREWLGKQASEFFDFYLLETGVVTRQ